MLPERNILPATVWAGRPAAVALGAFRAIRRFGQEQAGAVSADWIVLSALMILLALGSVAAMQDATVIVGTQIEASLDPASIDMSGIN